MALASIVDPGSSVVARLSRLAWAETVHPEGYLADLTEQLVRLLGVSVATVGAIDYARKSHRTIACYSAQKGPLGAFEQELLGSALAEVVGQTALCVPTGALQRFPLDWVIREHGADGFLGVPLLGASGDRVGVLALYHATELQVDPSILARLEVIGQRAAAELALHRAAFKKLQSSMVIAAREDSSVGYGDPLVPPPSDSSAFLNEWAGSPSALSNEVRYRRYFELGAMGMAFASIDGVLLEVNPCLCIMLGRERSQLLGVPWTDFCVPEEQFHERLRVIEIAEGKSSGFSSEVRFLLPNGSALAANFEVRCVRADDGQIECLTLLLQDLSERRKIEARLLQSQRLEAVGRLAGGIAHDFNNLLTAILAHTETVTYGADPGLDEMIDGVRGAALRAANLTSQLLAFARRQVIEPKVLELNRVTTAMRTIVQQVVGEGVEVAIRTTPNLWHVRVDPGQLEQVFLNLSASARDRMPRGGRLLIGTANVPREDVVSTLGDDIPMLDYVALMVSDNGAAMSEETLCHLFEPFYASTEDGSGKGLGLATCHGIVSQNGGHIRVKSLPSVGTTFRVYLPRYHSETVTAPSVPPSSAVAAAEETILLVEDDDMVRRVAVRVLKSKGFFVLSAASGSEALDVADRHQGPIHLLLTDLVMPKLSGDKLALVLGPRRPEMRILYTSGYAEAAHDHGLGPGANFLQKPYTPRQLVAQIRKVLDKVK